MRWIDRFAYGSPIRKLDPVYKTGFSLLIIFFCLAAGRPFISIAALVIVLSLSLFIASLPAGFLLKLLFAEGGFLFFSVLGVALSIHTQPDVGGFPLGCFYILITPSSFTLAITLFLRSLACVAAMNFLALTTPLIDLIALFRRMHIPELLIDLMTLIYRFIFTLVDCLERMVLAMETRCGFCNWRRSMASAGQIGANLFIETYRKSRNLEKALEGRCWDGSLHVLPQEYDGLAELKGQIFRKRNHET